MSVRIYKREYQWLKSYKVRYGRHATVEEVENEFRMLRFEPYAPVVRQLYIVLRAVNKERRRAGLPEVGTEVVRTRRKVVRPFEEPPPRRVA